MNLDNNFQFFSYPGYQNQFWQGSLDSVAFDATSARVKLLNIDKTCYFVRNERGRIGITNAGNLGPSSNTKTEQMELVMAVPPLPLQRLGDPEFLAFHGVKCAYVAGSMANGIASEKLVIALRKNGILSSFGSAGLAPSRIETAIHQIQQALPEGPYAFNLIHSPSEDALERATVDLYLRYSVRTIETSAFLDLTPHIVYYRASGLSLNSANQIEIKNKVIAKVSRTEVATKFLQPPPLKILKHLVSQKLITELQAKLAEKTPMADDLTVEADSGGHTDNRPLVCLLPAILALKDEIQEKYHYENQVRVGAAGGIGTPNSALAAFVMGAAYVMTGSINQACVEAGTSQYTKNLLAQASMTDITMAPAADMFEIGGKVQVLKKGTMFPKRSQKLLNLYKSYNSIEEIPLTEREKLETEIFGTNLDSIWNDTVAFFSKRDPAQITRLSSNPKRKMALVFRWYLGLSSRWANLNEKGRELDYQIWCGPSMGAFNNWVQGSYLADPNNRTVVDVAHHIMTGAAFLYRLQTMKMLGLKFPEHYSRYQPVPTTF